MVECGAVLQHPEWGVDVSCDREPRHTGGHLGAHPDDHRRIVGWTDDNTCNNHECRHEQHRTPLLDARGKWHRSECEFRACDWEPEED
jgi:hypothetical protein